MNRQHRRRAFTARKRSALTDMRSMGCTCSPSFTPTSVNDMVLAGRAPSWGFDIGHAVDCPFGDEVLALNRAGWAPVVFRTDRTCA